MGPNLEPLLMMDPVPAESPPEQRRVRFAFAAVVTWAALSAALLVVALARLSIDQSSTPEAASGNLRDDAFIRIPLRPEDSGYADIQGERLKN